MNYDVIIIGGGAAGLFCAFHAGQRGRRVLVLDHNDCIGRKITISGGGRCNFTNIQSNPDNFISSNPRFVISPLTRYTPQDFIQLIERHKIDYYEKQQGQLFCTESSQQIIQMLLKECQTGIVNIRLNSHVHDVKKNDSFHVSTDQGQFVSKALVIATGGRSIPKIGATGFGYDIARKFGLKLTEIRPGLVPLTFGDRDQEQWSSLRGISFDAMVRFQKTEFHEKVLFTHRGLSGPAILQISSYWKDGETLCFNLLPNLYIQDFIENHQRDNILLSNLLCNHLPKRFVQVWCERYISNKPVKQYSSKERAKIVDLLQNWPLKLQGTEGYSKAEVTVGGVDTRGLSSKTMESKKVPGLYFIGEVLDVTGHLGGHNFQWAWSSGFAAGTAV